MHLFGHGNGAENDRQSYLSPRPARLYRMHRWQDWEAPSEA